MKVQSCIHAKLEAAFRKLCAWLHGHICEHGTYCNMKTILKCYYKLLEINVQIPFSFVLEKCFLCSAARVASKSIYI